MKIQSSSIAMSSSHSYNSYTYKESMTLSSAASNNLAGAILTLSSESERQSYLEDMKSYQKQEEEKAAQKQKENEEKSAKAIAESMKASKANSKGKLEISDSAKLKMELLKKLFSMLSNGKGVTSSDIKYLGSGVLDLRSANYRSEESGSFSLSTSSSGVSVGTTSTGTLWQKVTATSGFTSEYEGTTFASSGMVQTADGRSIDFNIEVSMSRAFTCKIDTLTTETYIYTDPLMINLDTDIGTVSDQKFMFDLDSDGEEEEISFAGAGSGFLALDKNGDGIINDGSELFGTASGDGFKDLAAYDEDGNGWIDENDSIFSQLKVWTKDENGKDVLLDLKQADVGAIYLGNADTEFSLKNSENQTNGALRRTGIYLKESSGSVGTVNHVDLAI